MKNVSLPKDNKDSIPEPTKGLEGNCFPFCFYGESILYQNRCSILFVWVGPNSYILLRFAHWV